jgi:hypothetical protein
LYVGNIDETVKQSEMLHNELNEYVIYVNTNAVGSKGLGVPLTYALCFSPYSLLLSIWNMGMVRELGLPLFLIP